VAALPLLAAGIAWRAAVAFPSHKYPLDADSILPALCAFKVLRGFHPVFYATVRHGSLGSYLVALLFQLVGASRSALAAQPLIVDVLVLLFWWLFLREALGPRAATAGLAFAALPSPTFSYWTYLPLGYAEDVLFCAVTLWLAVRLARLTRGPAAAAPPEPEAAAAPAAEVPGQARSGQGGWTALGLGLAAGLGFWSSFETLECTIPACLWLLWQRPRLARRASVVLLVLLIAGGFLLGASPWIGFNVRHPWESFRHRRAIHAAGLDAMAVAARHIATDLLPELVTAPVPDDGSPDRPGPVARALRVPTVAIHALAAALLLAAAARPLTRRRRRPGDAAGDPEPAVASLFGLVALAACVLYVIAGEATNSLPKVRYILPLYLLVPAALALLLAAAAKRSRWLAGGLAAVVLAFNVAGTFLPWSPQRQRWAADAAADARLLAELERQRIDAVIGSYWKVYPINFLSRERIQGVPVEGDFDYYWVAARLPSRPLRWALLASDVRQLERWRAQAGLAGSPVQVTPFYSLLVPTPDPPAGETPAALQARLAAAYRAAALPVLPRR